MQTKIWDLSKNIDSSEAETALKEIAEIYKEGGLVAIPTETVYGLGANAKDNAAVKKFTKQKEDLQIIH